MYKMKKILLSFLFFGSLLGALAQDNQKNSSESIDKSTLTLRPNSKEYAPVRKTNTHQRIEVKQRRTILINRIQQQERPRKIDKPEVRKAPISRQYRRTMRSQQEIMKRQQQRILRRKMILQQQRKMRRR